MKIPFSKDKIFNAIKESVKINKIKSGYIRPIAYYGYGIMGLDPREAPVNVAIIVWPWGSYLGKEAVKVKTSSFIRIHPKSMKADMKISGHYVNSILASLEAKKQGYNEPLLLDYEGNVAEGPGENIFMIKNKIIKTPPLKGQILTGITRNSIIKIAKDLSYKVEEVDIKLKDLKNADEIFMTGTAAEVHPVKQIDETIINNGITGTITKKLKEEFKKITKGENQKYENWLTYV